MSKRWYNYFVSVEEGAEGAPEQPPAEESAQSPYRTAGRPAVKTAAPAAAKSAAHTVAEIAASVVNAEPKFTKPVSNPTSFEEIYKAAEIRSAPHGFTIFKVADLLQSEHVRNLPANVKRSSVLLALEAAGVKVEEVIQDAVARDRALDTYERVQQKAIEELEAKKTRENQQIQAELDRLVAEHQARIKSNTDEVARERERFASWRNRKHQEEQRIADAISPFVLENPISTPPATGAERSGPAAVKPGKT